MTTLTITPKVADKTARFKGTVAAGEHVAVTIKGGAEWLGEDDGANLTLRVLDLVTGRTLAVFPRPQETMEDGETPDAWSEATEDENDLYCELNLNTTRMVAAARHMLRVPVLFVLGDTDAPRTLYFRDRYEVEFWPERIGDDTPYDLDKWPKQIDEWTDLVATWTSRMNNLALDAERVDGGVKIMLNDGTLETPKEVVVNDGEVSRNEMNAAIAAMGSTKQNTLTFDAIPTEGSENPVKSGGVHGVVKEVADDVANHVNNVDIHVTATQKTAWTAKYDKPQDGIPKADLAAAVQTSLGKADTAIQSHQSLDAYVNAAGYDSDAKEIQLKHDSTVVARINATAFIKDGMVDSVEISGGNLVISFNTDSGVEDIEIPLTDIFNPANYYDKIAADGRFVQKETGKGLVAVDAALSTEGAAADAKAVGGALRSGFTEWDGDSPWGKPVWFDATGSYRWVLLDDGVPFIEPTEDVGNADATRLVFLDGEDEYEFTRHLVTPTKTSQLTNNSGFIISHQDISGKLDGAAAYPAWVLQDYQPPAIVSHKGRLWSCQNYTYSEPGEESQSDWLEVTIEDLKQDALSPSQLDAVNSGATPEKVAIWDRYAAQIALKANASDVAAALAQKASLTDLPYALVTPGEWEFSGSGMQSGHAYTIEEINYSGTWAYQLKDNGTTISTYETIDQIAHGESIDFENTFDPVSITATRGPKLIDRANNLIDATTGNVTLTLPAYQEGKVRDLLVHVDLGDDGTNPYTVTVDFPSGETNTGFKVKGNASAPIPAPDAAGEWLFSFSESSPHKIAVSLAQLQDATVAGGS